MKYDVVVIGSGPGGYVGAIRAAQLGMKVAIIEKYNTLGGTCLNVGCIPSKALLDSSEHYHAAQEKFADHGIQISGLKADIKKMVARKNEVVSQTCKGVEFLMKKNKIDIYTGVASFVNKNTILIQGENDKKEIETDKVIIATGSKPVTPAMFNYDKNRVITSTEALNIEKIPSKMVIVGGGVIGLELGSVFARLGTLVEVVEFMDKIIPTMDAECGKELLKSLKKLGIKFHLSHGVTGVKATKTSCTVTVKKKDSEESFDIKADYCLVAIGRRPYTEGLNLEAAGLSTDEKGHIPVNENLETSVPGIFAIGDVIRGAMLAHKAEEEGVFVAEYLAGGKPHINYDLIPGVVYTWPEVAAVGKTEEELKASGVSYKTGKFPFKALGRARASMDTDGFIKVLADTTTDEILGVHMVGPRVADVIMEAVSLMEFRASAEDLARICHPHPTFTEALKEAALDATGKRAIHM
ncbi:MAG: dihydrolipoyl dehydrogenase [Saprospiraceae bacterium]|nr:MAG: dihydrolipoamide dehydrogenase [Bacteroidetes bacterium OLB9]MCO6464329.1 dihydrolipoyl dehydrogenase [Saprospiraceae bacterium]MCZ2338308.1 dihydrolipoyl dehydrogenase [Chitinophagales bacterium]